MEQSLETGPPPAPLRPRAAFEAAGFFAVLLALTLPDLLAQARSPTLGLAWSELCTMLLPALVAAAGSNLRPAPYLGLDRPRPAAVLLGALLGAAGFLAANGILALWVMVLPRSILDLFPDVSRIFEGPPLERTATVAVAVLLAPLCEETAFRGYLQRTLLRDLGPGRAVGLVALLFAARHLDPVRFPALTALGALFGWLSWRGGSLWPAIAGHLANNALATTLSLLAPPGASPPTRPTLWDALSLLAVGGAGVVALAAAFEKVAPAAPAGGEELPRRDPADPSFKFRLGRVPRPLLAAASAGLLALFALLFASAP
ncbi:MAG TPA: CPBP family intramembrane glutamic endopeptidase [Anaeromyxobacter sp.]|nr:CPBP family intramembrane glutamic endopeptidase [Anaeromyxobacter sp.]